MHKIHDFNPVTWLCSAFDVLGRPAHRPRADRPNDPPPPSVFKILKQGEDYVEVLHKETGAVWRFDTTVVRSPT